MKTYRLRIVFVHYFKNLCNLRNLWIKSLFGCGYAALCYLLQHLFEMLFMPPRNIVESQATGIQIDFLLGKNHTLNEIY